MPPELTTGIPGPRRDRILVVAYWILGIIAAAELIVASVGIAPKLASSVRKSRPDHETPAAVAATTPQALPASQKASAAPVAPARETQEAVTAATDFPRASDSESSDRPLRQPPADTASPGGAVLEVLNARIEGEQDGSKTLQLAIKSRSRETIDVPQVKVQVYFYDEENGEVVPSKAQVTSRWLSAPVDWQNGKPELLEVRYLSDSADENVRFAGYLVAIYYKGDLQDCRSDPPKLKKLFEPKYFIGLDEP